MLEVGIDDLNYDKEEYEPYLIEAKTESNNVDFEYSMAQFCELPHEQEVNFKDNKKIKIVSVEKL